MENRRYYQLSEDEYGRLDSGTVYPPPPSLLNLLHEGGKRFSIIDKEVLEIGCGTGSLGHELLKMGAKKVVGIDVASSAISLAKDNFSAISFIHQDLLSMNYAEEFDLVVDSHCLHGLTHDQERQEALSRIFQALKVGGIFIWESMIYHRALAFAENYVLDNDLILWKEFNGPISPCDLKVNEGKRFIPYRRILRSIQIEEELKNAHFNIQYLMVRPGMKFVIDNDRPASASDPDLMQIIARK